MRPDEEEKMSLFLELLLKGGPITMIVFLLGFLALIIILERLFHYHRAQIDVPEFLRGIFNVLRRGNVPEAVSLCDETPGPVAQTLRSIILQCDRGDSEMERAAEEASVTEIPRLERNVKLLATIAYLSPLLGLLGTVVGMITLFRHIQEGGVYVETKTLAEGIWQALISTAAGLTVAITAYGFHNYFIARIDSLVVEMEKSGLEMIHFLLENRLQLADAEREATDLDEIPPDEAIQN
jgi:biopolymer transport protein ExbB